jgi:hypothetical protein
MDLIERVFGLSPDGGSGAVEFALLVVPLLVAAGVRVLGRRRPAA